jgi:Acetyltransferase (GNAT) domain
MPEGSVLLLDRATAIDFAARHAEVLDAPGNPTNPFAGSVWIRHFLQHVAADDWTVLVPKVDGDGTSLMWLYRRPAASGRALSLANYYASLYSPMASTAADRGAAIAALAEQLAAVRPRLATVNFAPLDDGAAETDALAAALESRGWFVRRYDCFGNWTLPCDGLAFDAYLAGRDSQLRNTLERKAKKLLAAGSLSIATRPDEVDAAMDAYDRVYARSWKKPEPYPGFVRDWARRCAEQGWLRLGVARIGDEPIAAQFWFTTARRASIFKLAYDEAHAKWSAGTVLSAHLFRHALDVDRVREIDYLTGDDAYKRAWMVERRQRIGLIACNLRSIAGLGAAATEMAGRARARLRLRAAAMPA